MISSATGFEIALRFRDINSTTSVSLYIVSFQFQRGLHCLAAQLLVRNVLTFSEVQFPPVIDGIPMDKSFIVNDQSPVSLR